MIDTNVLVAAGIDRTRAGIFAGPLATACARFRIDTADERAAFLAQCAHESGLFQRLSEGLFYSHADRIMAIFGPHFPGGLDEAAEFVGQPEKLANRVYANRGGNGDEASGDGFAFRGSGLIQLTFRDAHAACAGYFGMAPEDVGAWCRTALGAALSAAWFWSTNGCGKALEGHGFDATTRIVNGPAMAGAAERRVLFAKFQQAVDA